MKCFVTGGSGFVGANVIRELNRQGHEVRALLRRGSSQLGLAGLDYEVVEGDLSERGDWEKALQGCDWCFHVAASYHLWLPDYKPMYAANVEGTRHLIEAAQVAGCSRIVYTSTVGCIGLPTQAEIAAGKLGTEDDFATEAQMSNPYKHSKWLAEQVALDFAQKGYPVVIVNPSAPIGPYDVKPTPTGQMILDFLQGKMPAYLDTGLNWVHVRDVAQAHIAAAEKGRVGERYILGLQEGNLTLAGALNLLSEITGHPAPKFKIPYGVAWLAAQCSTGWAGVTGKAPGVPIAGVRMAKYKMWFDASKAVEELGMPQTPLKEAFSEAIDWFRENGFL